MNRIPYNFSILRYVHDSVTQEFVNIGVALYSHEARYLHARCTTNDSRIEGMFARIDAANFRKLTSSIEAEIEKLSADLRSGVQLETCRAIDQLLARVLPPDDGSLQFAPAGVGLSRDLDKTFQDLFDRYVERYTGDSDQVRCDTGGVCQRSIGG